MKLLPFKGGLLAALAAFALDRLSKEAVLSEALVINKGPLFHQITSFFNIILAWNKGVSFSLFTSPSLTTRWALCSIALAFSLLLVWWILKSHDRLEALAYGMILGGALGNVYDRVQFGAVIDFLDFHYAGFHWYTFNIADTAIVLGVLLLTTRMIFVRETA